ncbi:MAG: hypothetical protein MJE68_16250 [Proteobacteria bacterium]|nr:hypothetical protein [Pseudomonadota bacterium]
MCISLKERRKEGGRERERERKREREREREREEEKEREREKGLMKGGRERTNEGREKDTLCIKKLHHGNICYRLYVSVVRYWLWVVPYREPTPSTTENQGKIGFKRSQSDSS